MSLYEIPVGPYALEVVVGEWWLGDRNCLRIWGLRPGDGFVWPHVLTIRWRGWRLTNATGRVVARARRGIYRSLYVPDIDMAAIIGREGDLR